MSALVRALQRRFGLRLHAGLHATLAERAFTLVGEGAAHSLYELAERLPHLDARDPVVEALRAAASIGETYFHRAPAQLRELASVVRREIAPHRKRQPLRAWSAGCATGEEAYSLAMLLGGEPGAPVHIVGSDMNGSFLSRARQAEYGPRSFRAVKPEQLPGLVPSAGGWSVRVATRARVTFVEANLVTDALPDAARDLHGFHVVVCRNVLIYVDPDRIQEVMRKIAASAAPSAVVALGPAEHAAARHLEGFSPRGRGLWVKAPALRVAVSNPPAMKPSPAAQSVPPPTTIEPKERREVADSGGGDRVAAARTAADRGDLAAAERLAVEAIALLAGSAEPRCLLGQILLAMDRPREAAEELQRALFLDRAFVPAQLGMAEALRRLGNRAEAGRHARRALKLLRALPADAMAPGMELTAAAAIRLAEQLSSEDGTP
ncbi:MAG TPA: CheR family methyltransferase [Myxococcaceae bacterium]|nr:CheR family methyltransferase [Myxococcaceae bacterium]